MDSTSLLNKVKANIDEIYHITFDKIYNKLDNFNIVKIPTSITNILKLKTKFEVIENKKTKLFVDSIDSILSENSGKAYTLIVKTNNIIMFEQTRYVDSYYYGSNSDIESDIYKNLENLGYIYVNLINFTINNLVSGKKIDTEKEFIPIELKYQQDIMVKGGKNKY